MIEFVIEAMVDSVTVVDVDGRISLSNSGAVRLTGYTTEELRGMPIARLLIEDNSGLRTVAREKIARGNVLRSEESWLLTKAGERIPVSVTASPVVDTEGKLQGIVIVARDVRQIRQLLVDKEAEIGRRRAAEEELRAAKASIEAQLDQTRTMLLLAERRATLGTLAGGVGHELRNIAQIQVAAVDELQLAMANNEDVVALTRQILPDLERVGDHITQHGNRLMQLARPGPDHVSPIALDAVVRDVIEMLRQAGMLRRVHVVAAPAEGVMVTVNRTRIEQILVNLVSNAVDAIGGSTGTIEIEVRAAGDRAVCTVRDDGCGMPPATRDRIFEPFFTTKSPETGTGLGLTVVREIVESYGGTISVDSNVGTGTTFTFDLPR